MRARVISSFAALLLIFPFSTFAQETTGTIRGSVVLQDQNLALHDVGVLIVQLGRNVRTAEDGTFEFLNVPAGVYDLVASTAGMTSQLQNVQVTAGGTATANFTVSLSPIRQEVTVTATGVQETAFESFQIVTSLDSFDLAAQGATAVGEVLDNEPGVAKRSMGPGAARPVIRGFDGDRVLVLQDGVKTGSLASQSGDHGEQIDVLQLERLEVVKGPATLMYGSNAVGGVVNAVSGHLQMEERAREGFRGFMTGIAGTANRHLGGGTGFEYGVRKLLVWGSTGNQKTGDYKTPEGKVPNTQTRLTTGTAGLGWYGTRGFLGLNYTYDDGRYGIPAVSPDPEEAPEFADIRHFRRNLRISGGVANHNAAIEHIRFDVNYSGYVHNEIDKGGGSDEVATHFDNKTYTGQVFFDQRKTGRLTGTLGFSILHRDYDVEGAEALSPPVKQNVAAAFALEEMSFDSFKLQFGGRVESTRYDPSGLDNRSFTGLSGSVGSHVPLWTGGAFVTNYTHSYRAPAIEELYNNGPHPGNLAFEIGNPNLDNERSDGIDVALRHLSERVRFDANFFFYDMGRFVFLAPTGEFNEGFIEGRYVQGRARYTGTEVTLDFPVHPNFYINSGVDYVRAELRADNTPLPRIPPLRVRLGFDARYKGLSVKPELVVAERQDRVFSTETPTDGYAVVDLTASYTIPQQHFSHHVAVNVFNAGDKLYRNHLSLIKDLVSEIGRGVRVTYSVKFF